jgi:hypothetical protein
MSIYYIKLFKVLYKLNSFTIYICLKQEKEIGSPKKNGHLFLSIFRNLEDKFLFFKQKVVSLENALNTKNIILG